MSRSVNNNVRRKYQLKQRAKRQAETRQRIVEAAVSLHEALGPARTTISALARKAGVQRLTVYRHFPREEDIFTACGQHYLTQNPPPDPSSWPPVSDPEKRLRQALLEIYQYHARTEQMMASFYRDYPLKPASLKATAPYIQHWQHLRDSLAQGFPLDDERRPLLLAALAHALDFRTWQSLVRGQVLDNQQAVELMAGMVLAVARPLPVGADSLSP
ncbi:MAG TPA: TetR/AcrR family transcriptional regulator [Dehalococcoidia bacterium]|nr:TetR/AcrR family transcriptional regulator [Dehalococcoidia bacterium]